MQVIDNTYDGHESRLCFGLSLLDRLWNWLSERARTQWENLFPDLTLKGVQLHKKGVRILHIMFGGLCCTAFTRLRFWLELPLLCEYFGSVQDLHRDLMALLSGDLGIRDTYPQAKP